MDGKKQEKMYRWHKNVFGLVRGTKEWYNESNHTSEVSTC